MASLGVQVSRPYSKDPMFRRQGVPLYQLEIQYLVVSEFRLEEPDWYLFK